MKLVNFKLIGAVTLVAAMVTMNSCKKETVTTTPINKNTTKSSVNPKEVVNEVNAMYIEVASVMQELGNGGLDGKKEGVSALLASCGTLTVDTDQALKVIEFDFGTGCTENGGEFRAGHVRIEFTDYGIRYNGCQATATFTSYTSDDIEYNGTMTMHNMGPNGFGNPEITLVTNLTKEDHSNGTNISMNVNLTHEWISGSLTDTRDDDALSCTGTVSGQDNVSGDLYSLNITSPLITDYAPTCLPLFNKGVWDFTAGINPTETLDYGDGTCDDQALYIVNGDTTQITIN